jgi:DivIVA domain-containing protein
MPEDRRMTISSSSPLSPDEVARRTFATARRGYAPDEVRA